MQIMAQLTPHHMRQMAVLKKITSEYVRRRASVEVNNYCATREVV
jgi:hypothetical protein